MQNKILDAVAFICLKDKKLLNARTKGKDIFYLPGGKYEAGETDAQALAREIKEELDVDIDPSTMKLLGVFEAEAHGRPRTTIRMHCYTADYKGKVKASSEIEEIAWLSYKDVNKTPPLGKVVFDWLHEKGMLV